MTRSIGSSRSRRSTVPLQPISRSSLWAPRQSSSSPSSSAARRRQREHHRWLVSSRLALPHLPRRRTGVVEVGQFLLLLERVHAPEAVVTIASNWRCFISREKGSNTSSSPGSM